MTASGRPHEVTDHMLFAVPKKGRLFDKVEKLLEGCGLDYVRPSRVDIAHCKSLPITIVFLPAADIAAYVGEGNVDMGITGEDIVAESEVDVDVIMKLGFGKCKLALQAPVCDNIKDPKVMVGKRIVTSFPNAAHKYFDQLQEDIPAEQRVATQIKFVSGSVEAACGLGLADSIVDLVETGTTMKAAGLEVVDTIMETETVVIKNKATLHSDMIEKVRERISGYITATQYVMITYNVERKLLPQAQAITPGKKSPTVTSLENADWVSVSALTKKKGVHTIMDQLQEVGATDILVFNIGSTRMGK
jgi:ATP phosphoribosyltransferase